MKKKYDLKLSTKSCQDLKKRILDFSKELENIIPMYLNECLEWIYDKSIENLQINDTFNPSYISDIREAYRFNRVSSTRWNLEYYSDIVFWVEFGTGLVGEDDPHPMADELNYEYAVGEYSGSNMGMWRWYNPKYGVYWNNAIYTQGYKGKRFIYEAFRDFVDDKIYFLIYKSLFDKIFNKYF